jgi:PAS domain S-box-containing protein
MIDMAKSESIRVLYMEADPILAKLCKKKLEKAGYVIDLAHNGEECLALYAKGSYGIVIVDQSMPLCDGLDVIRDLVIQDSIPPLIMITDIGNAHIAEEAVRIGASDYVVKDTENEFLDLLPKVIEGAISRHQQCEDKRKAEEALQDGEERYRTLFRDIPVGLYRTMPDGQILDANPALVEMLGYQSRDSLLEVNATEIFFRPEDRQRERELVEREGVVRGFEVQLCRKDGTVIWVWDTTRAVRDSVGQTLYFEGSLVDITERKRAGKELQESNRRLDETLAELRETQRIAILQERLAAVGQLAAGIAHDFNNIMAAISLFSDLLLREPNLSIKGRERLSIIIMQTQRAATLIRQILDFSRKTVMDLHPIDLGPFLKEFEKLLERTLPENIRLILVRDNKDFIVNADPGRIQQVFMNLVLNARDAMRKGGELCIEIDHYRFRSDQQTPFPGMDRSGWVRIRVADTGTGIPADVLPYIFEPFFTTKGPGQGTGLGLAQVYGIVKQHNGFIDVASQDGEGTIFTIYLPSLEILIPKEPMLDRHLIDNGEGETILVVEDDEAARQGICETLEGLNYHVLRASNGREALTFIGAGAESVDLVLSDIVMPEMGGMELYQEVQEIAPELPLVLITGYPLGKGTRELLDENRLVWLQKPLDVEELAREMRKMLRKR